MSIQTSDSDHTITCYDCDHEYSYIGADPHPGRCPRCSAEGVSPAGQLEPFASRIVLVDGRPEVKVLATDETDRLFFYRISTTGGCATCIEVLIEDSHLSERNHWPDELVPAPVWRTVDEYGYRQCTGAVETDMN